MGSVAAPGFFGLFGDGIVQKGHFSVYVGFLGLRPKNFPISGEEWSPGAVTDWDPNLEILEKFRPFLERRDP